MKLFSLNIRGFGGIPKIRALEDLLDSTCLELVFFQETMCSGE